MLTKDKIHQLVDHMPETFSSEDIIGEIILLQKIEIARQQIANGEGSDWEDVKKRNGFMVKITLSKIAKNDLREIVAYIKRDSVKYAILERKKIVSAIDKLYVHPLLGKKFTELDAGDLYELIHNNYRIIYEIVNANHISILTIHHHARSITNNPAFTDED